MYVISSQNTQCRINDLGFIESWSCNQNCITKAAYIVLFKEYSRMDPSCRLWDVQSEIQVNRIEQSFIEYNKQIESVTIFSRIEIHDDGWEWELTLKGSYPPCHYFGITHPVDSEKAQSINGKIQTSIIQYAPSLQEIYADQSSVDIPLLKCGSYASFISAKQSCQFFRYKDADTPYLRIASSTSLTGTLTISHKFCKSIDQAEKQYINTYPEFDEYINTWKPRLKKIANYHNIKISYQHQDIKSTLEQLQEITAETPAPVDLKKYSTLLDIELKKYPCGFLGDIGIDGILLCGTMKMRYFIKEKYQGINQVKGLVLGRHSKRKTWILCDVTHYETKLIHHEIFHCIQDEISVPQVEESEETQATLFSELMAGTPNENRTKELDAIKHAITMKFPSFKFDRPRSVDGRTMLVKSTKNEVHQMYFGAIPEYDVLKFAAKKEWL